MDDNKKNLTLTLAAGIAKKVLITLSASAATHGYINANQTETFVSVGLFVLGIGWSFWNDYGRAIVLSQLEVLKAKSLAQAAKLQDNGIRQVSVSEIAAQSPTMTEASAAKAISTLPPAVQAGVVKTLLLAVAVVTVAMIAAPAAQAQTKLTGNLAKDIHTAVTTGKPAASDQLTKIMSDIASIKADLIAGTIADIQAADGGASIVVNASTGDVRDPISHACYPALVKFLGSLPTAAPPSGAFTLVQLFQRKRDFVMQLQAGIPSYLKLGCSALLGDEQQILIKGLGLVGIAVGANMLAPGLGSFAMPGLL